VEFPPTTANAVQVEHARLLQKLKDAKAAKAAYKTAHPAEFPEPRRGPNSRGGASTGRGRGRAA
jgi:hypothetical protein